MKRPEDMTGEESELKRPEDMNDDELEAATERLKKMTDKEFRTTLKRLEYSGKKGLEAGIKRPQDMSNDELKTEMKVEIEKARRSDLVLHPYLAEIESRMSRAWLRFLDLGYEWQCRQVRVGVSNEMDMKVSLELAKLPGGTENWFFWSLDMMERPANAWRQSLRDALKNPDGSNNTSFFEALVPDHASLNDLQLSKRLKKMGIRMSNHTVHSYFKRDK